MSGPVTGTGSKIPAYCKPEDGRATVKNGEDTIQKVVNRLGKEGIDVDVDALKKANPQIKDFNKLQQGQDICLPEKSKTAQPTNNQEREIGKVYTNKEKDPKPPQGRVGDYNVPIPSPKGETDDTYERGTNRKDDQQRLDNARRPDDRDLDPKVKAEEKRNKIEGSARNHVDPQTKKGINEATTEGKQEKARQYDAREQMIREQADKLRGVQKQKHFSDVK